MGRPPRITKPGRAHHVLNRRAKLVKRAEARRWCSLWARRGGTSALRRWLSPWPVDWPRSWLAEVNRPLEDRAIESVRQSPARGAPLGDERWTGAMASRLGLGNTLRPRGRPRKEPRKSS